ncbi:uncharacterized protein TRAVEDRAFT_47066 [Trametes versicolor FP-101664 SS1]|uniref:uncharacterized protein n=1 Tax=Trametes versicolor (strain FP-101664) TaxID=717944 RepID=UPI00046218BD|nr:uncharacterized protein TRAVEDRAFT_47066 [Trametes versicolor FP-101664 SS1]EIW59765.1 hypothetical protein TRAVEDRAFT_47066 [Trametes versicolor FP-101664 SS1]
MTPGNLADQMRLGQTVRGLRVFSKVVGRISTLSEDLKDTLDLQIISTKSPDVWTLVDIVKDEFPFMNAYDKAWPIFAIVREHRHKKLYGRRDGLVDWERKAPPSADGDPRELLETPPVPPPRPDSGDAAASALSRTVHEGDAHGTVGSPGAGSAGSSQHSQVNTPNRGSNERDVQAQGQSTNRVAHPGDHASTTASQASRPRLAPASPAHSPSAAGPSQSTQGAPEGKDKRDPVFEFLDALFPEQTSLLPLLVSKGIVDGAALNAFARFPSRRRKLLLNAWLREESITELQFEVLNEGFENMGA